jgi:hypothetical protein
MPSTSVHFPEIVLSDLDRLATLTGQSRNRLIVESCRQLIAAHRVWPERLFGVGLSPEDREELRRSAQEMEEAILTARVSRPNPEFP